MPSTRAIDRAIDPVPSAGPAFARLIEALRPTARVYSLHALKELSVKALELSDATAVALASALQGHPKLAELELWNVGLDDDGAIAIAQLATPQGNAALRRLNLGRNLMSGSGKVRPSLVPPRTTDAARPASCLTHPPLPLRSPFAFQRSRSASCLTLPRPAVIDRRRSNRWSRGPRSSCARTKHELPPHVAFLVAARSLARGEDEKTTQLKWP